MQLSEQHGIDTYLHFIRRLIVHSQIRLTSTASPAAFDASSALTFRLLVQETQRLARDPFLADRFRDGIDRGDGDTFRNFDFVKFADRVGLRPLERLILASSIVAAPTRRELLAQASTVIRVDFENAVLALCQHPSFDHADLNPNQVAKLLSNLLAEPPPDAPILDATQRQALIIAAQAKYGSEIVSPILQRILPSLRYVFHEVVRPTPTEPCDLPAPAFPLIRLSSKHWCNSGPKLLVMPTSFGPFYDASALTRTTLPPMPKWLTL